jgi:hypothetical protein
MIALVAQADAHWLRRRMPADREELVLIDQLADTTINALARHPGQDLELFRQHIAVQGARGCILPPSPPRR